MLIRDNKRQKNGSALILVVIVTVLLSVVGMMFVMTMRMREMTTANVTDDRDLDTAVGAVTGQIGTVLLQDLFGTGTSIVKTSNSYNDPWLASLEPDATTWTWPSITNLSGGAVTPALTAVVIPDYQAASSIQQGNPADADGDGVADSMWIQLADYTKTPPAPIVSTSKGKPVFAAVRIIDNCAMLNLNTAFGFYQQPSSIDARPMWKKPWFITSTWAPYLPGANNGENIGRYLSEVNFTALLRAYDVNRPERIQFARDTQAKIRNLLPLTDPYYYAYNSQADDYHNKAVMNIEVSNLPFSFFDISDELEIRNRFLLTSKSNSRFEKRDPQEQTHVNALPSIVIPVPANAYQGIAYQTFDFGQGKDVLSNFDTWSSFFEVRVASTPFTGSDFDQWKKKLNSSLFDDYPYPNPPHIPYYEYDRRHVCTFYSFDRNIRSGYHGRLDPAINSLPPLLSALQKQAIEEIFRPLKNLPIDLRTITDPAKLDPDTGNLVGITNNTLQARRNILHLLYAFREKEYEALGAIGGGYDPNALAPSARKAAQQVANIIDFLDDTTTAATGPFGGGVYGSQINAGPTYINRAIVRQMILDVCNDYNTNNPTTPIPVIDIDLAAFSAFDFDLTATDVVYGYERQPFISEVYVNWDGTKATALLGFAVELVNPYDTDIKLKDWRLITGTSINHLFPEKDPASPSQDLVVPANGRLVVRSSSSVSVDPAAKTYDLNFSAVETNFKAGISIPIRLERPVPASSGHTTIISDAVDGNLVRSIFYDGQQSICRDDKAWRFTNGSAYENPATPTLGLANGVTLAQNGYQLPVDNANTPIDRLADFQKITWVEPNELTTQIANASDESEIRFDSQVDSELLRYVCTLSRGEKGIPGRININTAPVHVIAAAIPPQLVMSSLTDPNDAFAIAGQIVAGRPYKNINELLKNILVLKKYINDDPAIVGDVSINGDFEKRDWIFNRLSNIFTVRSDTFTAYILVRLGTDGPQRRMIAVFDRSNCWSATDKPKLVALHPVPDPR